MDRRDFLAASAASIAAMQMPRMVFAQNGTLYVYSGSDSNITDFWKNTIVPAFRRTGNETRIEVVDAGDSAGMRAMADRALAALSSNADPQLDLMEAFDPRQPSDGIEQGLWVNFNEIGLENSDRINPDAIDSPYSLPYRGSQVLLAFDSSKLNPEDAPTTWDELTAWIEANPGQFIYNRPDKGGSGGNFVRRAIHEANGRDPSKFTLDNFTPEFAEETLTPAWTLLAALGPHLYQNGTYTAGNTQSLQMLAQGVVTMVPVWSDQVLQAIREGVLPEDTGLVQLQDLALAGGFSRATIPTNAAHRDTAIELANFLLSEEIQTAILEELGGFPGVSWDYVSDELQEKYRLLIPRSIPTFPGGEWEAAINDGWYRNVAPGTPRE